METQTTTFLPLPKIRHTDISLRERFTLGWVIYRNRFTTASVSWLARQTHQDRSTCRRHLETLAKKDYVIKTSSGWTAIENPRFIKKKIQDGKRWFENIQYFRIKIFGKPIKRLARYVIHFLVNGMAGKDGKRHPQIKEHQTSVGLAKMLGCDRSVVSRAVKTLAEEGKIIRVNILNKTGSVCGWLLKPAENL